MRSFVKEGSGTYLSDQHFFDKEAHSPDLFNYGPQAAALLERLRSRPNQSVTALVGPPGSGKTFLLHLVMKQMQEDPKASPDSLSRAEYGPVRPQSNRNKDSCWAYFSAWRYPDHKELWEAFTVEITRSITGFFGRAWIAAWSLVHKLWTTSAHIVLLTGVLTLAVVLFSSNLELGAIPLALGSITLAALAGGMFKRSAVEKLREYEDAIHDALFFTNKSVYIVLEDIDRSTDESGRVFLEAVSYLMRNRTLNASRTRLGARMARFKRGPLSRFSQIDKKIQVIVPMATQLIGLSQDRDALQESFSKSVDYWEHVDYDRSVVLDNFVRAIFTDESLASGHESITQVLHHLLDSPHTRATVRAMQNLVKNAETLFGKIYASYPGADIKPAVCMLVELTKLLPPDDKDGFTNMFEEIRSKACVTDGGVDQLLIGMCDADCSKKLTKFRLAHPRKRLFRLWPCIDSCNSVCCSDKPKDYQSAGSKAPGRVASYYFEHD